MHSAGGPGRLRALVIVKISRAVGDACRAASGRRNRRRCREGDKPPIDSNGWWRRPHIPTRGEDSAACVRCPSPLAIVKNHPTCQGEVVGLAARRPFDECWRVPRKVALVEHIIYYKTHYLQFKGFLGPGPTQERTGEAVVVVEDQDQRC